jgi:hypothetical protein
MMALITCFVAAPCAAAWIGAHLTYSVRTEQIEIFRGVYYQTMQRNGSVVHLVEIDLNRPGIELFVTPLNHEAIANGREYRLDYVRNVARAEGLAVAINGTLFTSDSYVFPMVGDFATSLDTLISNYRINHLDPRDYIVWFDGHLTPHPEMTRPAPLVALQHAKWAIGGRRVVTSEKMIKIQGDKPAKRTLVGVNGQKRKMWFGVFESATKRDATEILLDAGAEYVMLLDGGGSTSLYFGGRTHGVQHGLRFGGQTPVATVIGIKADPILDPQ